MKRTTWEMTPQIRTSSGVLRRFSYQGVNCFETLPLEQLFALCRDTKQVENIRLRN